MAGGSDQKFIEDELKYVKDNLMETADGTEIIACHIALVQVRVR